MEQSTLSSDCDCAPPYADCMHPPVPSDHELLESLSYQVAAMQGQINGLLALLHEYGDQIKPTLEAMSKSPIMKMLGVKSNA